MDWWQWVDLLLLLFATASFFAPSLSLPSSHRLADFLNLLLVPNQIQRLSNKTNGLQRLHTRSLYCERLWLVWKRLNIASNYTMKPGFLLTFLLAGSTIVHACECLPIIYNIQVNFIHSVFVLFLLFSSLFFDSLSNIHLSAESLSNVCRTVASF